MLSKTGKLMTRFPLSPRQSRIIVEAILKYPEVTSETIIAAAFLSTQSPYLLPPGEETDARRAHHSFRDKGGDFVSYLKLFNAYKTSNDKPQFCVKYYLDERVMAEIANIVEQLELIVADIGVPLLSGGSIEDYLCCIARGLIQFVCVRQGKELYRSLTADHILIHPGSVMFKMDPQYIVAGEIIRTARMYASSVSPLSRETLEKLGGNVAGRLGFGKTKIERGKREKPNKDFANAKTGSQTLEIKTLKGRKKEHDSGKNLAALIDVLPLLLHPSIMKKGKKEGFICLGTDGSGKYRLHTMRGFHGALNESLSAVETLIDELGEEVSLDAKNIVNTTYRRLSEYLGR
jgi:HrpA-like RNA helicase